MIDGYYEKNELKLHYRQWLNTTGESRGWFTLLNGLMRPLTDFNRLSQFLNELGYSVLTVDFRGSGKTESSGSQTWTRDLFAQDVVGLWDHFDIPASSLLGISMGGTVAQTIALSQPERVSSLCLVSTTAHHSYLNRPDIRWSEDVENNSEIFRYYVDETYYQNNLILIKFMAEAMAKTSVSPQFSDAITRQNELVNTVDLRNQISSVSCPVYVIHGENDQIILPKSADELSELISQATLNKIPQCGHLILAEKQDKLQRLLRRYYTPPV